MNHMRSFLPHFVATLVVGILALIGGFYLATENSVQAAYLTQSAATAAPDSVPGVFNYQGVLRDSDGNLLTNGDYKMTFRIYESMTAATASWEETHDGVAVRSGRFGVTMGYSNTIASNVFATSADAFVGVTVDGFAEMQPRLRLASVPYALHAENSYDGVPVGGVIDWWPANGSTPIPAGYMICNGAQVTDESSSLFGLTLPDLGGKFTLGVTDPASARTTGGSSVHSHSIDHNHSPFTANTSFDGSHNHSWGFTGTGGDVNDYYTYDANGNSYKTINWGDGSDTAGAGNYWMEFGGTVYTDNESSHRHSVSVDVPNHSSNSGSSNHLPPYETMTKLCRIK